MAALKILYKIDVISRHVEVESFGGIDKDFWTYCLLSLSSEICEYTLRSISIFILFYWYNAGESLI